MKILVTGCAGFIGMHVAQRLLSRGDEVIGVDNLNDYYDVTLKHARLAQLAPYPNFTFHQMDITDSAALFARTKPQQVVHLAAQAGVRYSLENPAAYVEANLVGFLDILENCRHHYVEYLVYASSSSVYGGNAHTPFSEHDNVDHPISFYAATKKANELMAHTYSHLYQLPTTGLRFFTVYGPWGRPDMALFKFTRAILNDEPIDVYNQGQMLRDYTYIDDVVEAVLRLLAQPAKPNPEFNPKQPDPATSWAPYRIYNIGNRQPTNLLDYICAIEQATGKTAKLNLLPAQPGDVVNTYADTTELQAQTNFQPQTSIAEGVGRFVGWYQSTRHA